MADEIITFASYKAKTGRDGTAWVGSYSMTDTNKTIVMCAPSFRIVCTAKSVLFRDNWIRLDGYYWDGSVDSNNNPQWKPAFTGWEASVSGANETSFSFNHNREKESSDNEDQPHYHIWKFVVTMRGANGSAHSYFDVWWGGIEMMTDNEYNETCQWRIFRCCQPQCYTIDSGSMYSDANVCAKAVRPANYRGSSIHSHLSWLCGSDISLN